MSGSLGTHPKVIAVVQRLGHWIVPAVFMVIGTMIVIESAVAQSLFGG